MAKVVIQGQTTLGAGDVVANALTGNRYERCPFAAAWGTLWATSDAVNTCTIELNVGGKSVTPAIALSGANRMPMWDQDVICDEFEVLGNQLIQLTLVDSGAASVAWWRVQLTEAPLNVVQ